MNSQPSKNEQSALEWYQKVIYSCNHHEADMAAFVLGQWDNMIGFLSEQQRNELTRLKEKLLYTAFPSLPLDHVVGIIEKNLLYVLASEVDIDEILKKRFLFVGYGNENKERETLRGAALRNSQMVGGKTVTEWLQAFDKAYPPEKTQEVSAGKFFTQSSDIAALNRNEQALLRRLLQVYDEWLRAPLATIFDAAVVLNKLNELEKAGVKEVNMNTFEKEYLSPRGAARPSAPVTSRSSQTAPQGTLSLPLLQALSKYENLGNQLITEGRIRVKSQPEPVRPSLLYWLRYYRDELGIGQHSSVERGDFLFRSENGRKLSAPERERVNLILKSVEENFPLSIDPDRQEILFPAFHDVVLARLDEAAARQARPDTRSVSGGVPTPQRPASQDESLGKRAAPAPLAYRDEPLPRTYSPLPPSAKALGTPAFFVPRPEEDDAHEQKFAPPAPAASPVASHAGQYESGGLRIGRGTSFNVVKAVAPPVQAQNVRPNVPLGTGEVSFSTSHIFPAEREVVESRPRLEDSPRQVAAPKIEMPPAPELSFVVPAPVFKAAPEPPPMPRPVQKPLSAFHIRPVSLGGKKWESDRNDETV